jgi:predicted nucleotidyltransferase
MVTPDNSLDGEDIERIISYFKSNDEVSAVCIFGSASKGKATGDL